MQNTVTLLGYYGSDKTHALSAWQSTNIELKIEVSGLSERIDRLFDETQKGKKKHYGELLNFLANHKHETPFEKSALHFQITADIATHIHCLKHRIAVSINSESSRYKELKDKWYIPEDWDIFLETNPYTDELANNFALATNSVNWGEVLDNYNRLGHALYHKAIDDLSPVLGRSRAKESARFFLPYSKQLDFDMLFNFRSFMHFQELRNSPYAQKEVREIADKMLSQVQEIEGNPFEYSLKAFGY